MKIKITFFLLLLLANYTFSQTYNLDATTNGTTHITCDATLYDSGGPTGNYADNEAYEITFQTTGTGCIRAIIEDYDIEWSYDFLYFYDGPSSASPQISSWVSGFPQVNGSNRNEIGNAYYAQSGYITIRFESDGATVRSGFKLKIDCPDDCISPSCAGTTPAGDYCDTPTPICDFNGYCGNTSSSYPTDHEEIEDVAFGGSGIFCGGINNNSWLSFVADSTTAVLDVWVYNCQDGNGIQLQVYETDCGYNNFTPVSNCWSPAKEINGQVIASGLTVGNNYVLMIDGFAGDVCEYVFSASSGVIVADAGSDQTICEGQSVSLTASGGSSVIWSSVPPDPGLTGQETNMTINVSPSQTTTYTATVSGSNPSCPGNADVVVFVDAADASFSGLDISYCEDGTPVTLTGNYSSGVFSGSGVSGNTFDPSSVSPGIYDITYSYNYSVITAFFDNFDPWPDPGWIHGANTGTSSWQHGTPMGGNGQNSNIYSNDDPLTDHTSNTDNKVWGQGLSNTDGDGLGGYYDSSDEWLKSPAIDCSGLSNTVLSFWRYANFEPNWDESYVEISTDGVNFTQLTSEPLYPQDDGWVHRIINISSIADGQSTVYVRFRSVSDNLQTYSGWNIDDFSITGVQAGGTCVSTDVQQTTVDALPVVNAGTDATICSNETYTLSGSVSGNITTGTWSTAGTGSFDNSSSLTATYTPSATDISSGSVVLTLTSGDPAGPCGTSADNMTLNIINVDDAGFSYSSGTFCATASNPSPTVNTPGGTFTSSPAGLVIDAGTGLVDLASSVPQSYTITYTTNGTCPNSSTVSFTITNGFDSEFSYAGPFCQYSSNPLPVHTTGSDGVYSSTPSGLIFTNTSTGEIDLSASSPGTYTVTNTIAASGGCAASTSSYTVQIIQAPTCSAGNDDVICEGDTYILSGSAGGGASSITWAGGDGVFGNPLSPTSSYTPGAGDIANGSVVLTITTNDPGVPCTAASDQMTLTINQAAVVNAGNDTTICETDIFAATSASFGGGATMVSWTTNGDGIFDDSSAVNTGYTFGTGDISNGNVTLTITANDPDDTGPCSAVSDNIIITINQAPVADAGPDTSICEYDTYIVSGASMTGSSSITWTSSGDGAFSNTNILNPEYTPGPNDIINGNIVLSITSGNPSGPCTATSDSMLLKINTSPLLTVQIDSSNCNQSDGAITVSPVGGVEPYSYTWSVTGADSSITGLSSGNYSVTVTDDLGCFSDTTVHVYDIGAGTIVFDDYTNINCYGDSSAYISITMVDGTPVFTYSWSEGSNTDSIYNIPAGTYTVTVTDNNDCVVIDSIVITQPQTALDFTVNSVNISCNGLSDASIFVSVNGGTPPYDYLWSTGDTSSTLVNLNKGTYILVVVDSNGCTRTDSVVVIEPGAIQINHVLTQPSCPGSSDGKISLAATGGTGKLTYLWAYDNNVSGNTQAELEEGTYDITVTDENNCQSTYSVTLKSIEDVCLMIPTLFTPNNDNYNDTWLIKGAQFYDNLKIEIYNRWGDIVFSFAGSGNEYLNNPWDGKFNGKEMPMGSYVYIIDLGNGDEPLNGVVSLKR